MDQFVCDHGHNITDLHDSIDGQFAMTRNLSWQEISQLTGRELIRKPMDQYVNWYWDSVAYTLLNIWFIPFRMPELHSEADKWVSQFTLNGIKAGNVCRPS